MPTALDPATLKIYRLALYSPDGLSQLPQADLDHITQQGILLGLFDCGDAGCIDLILDTIRRHPREKLRDQAFRLLSQLAVDGNLPAQDAICSLVIFDEDPRALEVVIGKGFAPSDPDRQAAFFLLVGNFDQVTRLDPDFEQLTRTYRTAVPALQSRLVHSATPGALHEWGQVMEAIFYPNPERLAWLIAEVPSLSSEPVRQLAVKLLDEMTQSGSQEFLDTLVELGIFQGYPPARDVVLHRGFLPGDAARRSLFYLLTDQWEAYQALDFDQNLLADIYAKSSPGLRRRITSQVRRIGRVDWMQTISRGRRVRWLGEMNDADWFSVIETLARDGHWPQLWRLAQIAPPIWSAPMLLQLGKSGWLPADDLDRRGFEQLLQLAGSCAGIDIEVHSPRTLHTSPAEIACLAISPGGTQLAAGLSTGGILLWRFPGEKQPALLPTIPGPVWSLAFGLDGRTLASGHGDHTIRVWDTHTKRPLKTLEGHSAMVRGLQITPDNRTALSASFDGSVRAWRYPLGPEQKALSDHQAEQFCLAVSPDGRYAASGGASQAIQVWSLPRSEACSNITGHTDTVTCLEYDPTGTVLISGSRDKSLRTWSVPEGYPVSLLEGHAQLITCLAVHPNSKLLASASFDGQINLWSLPEGNLIQSLQPQRSSITGLRITPDGNTLVSASRDGQVLLWDLRPFVWVRLPVERVTPEEVHLVEEALADKRLSQGERTWFEYCRAQIQWRHQFDIELAETGHPIQVGDYDIEIGEVAG